MYVDNLIRLYTFCIIRYNNCNNQQCSNYKGGERMVQEVTLEEQKEVAINRYVDLMRIKAYETGENKELEYQIKVAKVKLSSFGIDYSELEL